MQKMVTNFVNEFEWEQFLEIKLPVCRLAITKWQNTFIDTKKLQEVGFACLSFGVFLKLKLWQHLSI